MVDIAQKVRENRLRRQARRLGLDLRKSRARAVRADDAGMWRITDRRGRPRWGRRWELGLDEVESILRDEEASELTRQHAG
jgi:hypothetical protein